jgi:hypothetical protein
MLLFTTSTLIVLIFMTSSAPRHARARGAAPLLPAVAGCAAVGALAALGGPAEA